MSAYFVTPFEFQDVLNFWGNYLYGVVGGNYQYSYYTPNTPMNATQYNDWMVWTDPNPMPTWDELTTGDAWQAYNAAQLALPVAESDINNLYALYAPVAFSGVYSDLTGKPSLAAVASSGSYLDLGNKPTIPAAQVQSDWNASSGLGVVLNKPTFAAVATSGSYADLTNKPASQAVSSASHSIVTSTSATGFQLSTSRLAFCNYSIQISATLSLTTGQSSTVYLETAATNSTTPSDWSVVSSVTNGNTGALTVGLNLVQTVTQCLSGLIAAGNYVRIRSSGTATVTYQSGQEMLF